MSDYDLTPLAKAGIFEIWVYIAEDNEAAADPVEQSIYDACKFVAESPLRGEQRRVYNLGCQSQGDTVEETLANIREAIELYLETLTDEERFAALSREILTTAIEVHA
jgi:hypothetical protein